MKSLISAILSYLVVWAAFGLLFNDFDKGVLFFSIAGIVTGYTIKKKVKV